MEALLAAIVLMFVTAQIGDDNSYTETTVVIGSYSCRPIEVEHESR